MLGKRISNISNIPPLVKETGVSKGYFKPNSGRLRFQGILVR
jgi:hypothetical protein